MQIEYDLSRFVISWTPLSLPQINFIQSQLIWIANGQTLFHRVNQSLLAKWEDEWRFFGHSCSNHCLKSRHSSDMNTTGNSESWLNDYHYVTTLNTHCIISYTSYQYTEDYALYFKPIIDLRCDKVHTCTCIRHSRSWHCSNQAHITTFSSQTSKKLFFFCTTL